jgi:hypothetical protein
MWRTGRCDVHNDARIRGAQVTELCDGRGRVGAAVAAGRRAIGEGARGQRQERLGVRRHGDIKAGESRGNGTVGVTGRHGQLDGRRREV